MTLSAVGTFASNAPVTAVLLHGWGSDERDLAALAPFLPDALPWASVRAPLRHPAYGYAWYPLDAEESWSEQGPIDAATDAVWAWADRALGPRTQLVPIGFSQGGLIASQLLRTRPKRVHAAVILSGYALPAAQGADAVLATRRPPVFWGRGELDSVIPRHAVAATEDVLPRIATLERHVYPALAHQVGEGELADVRAFLERVVEGETNVTAVQGSGPARPERHGSRDSGG